MLVAVFALGFVAGLRTLLAPAALLLVRGGESDVLDPEAAERFAAVLPHGQLVTVPGAGHNVHSANTPGFLEVVSPFLASQG